MSREWWRERYRNRTPEQRAEHIRKCSERRAKNRVTDPAYAERERTYGRQKQREKRKDPKVLQAQRDFMRRRRADNPEMAEKARQWAANARRADIVKYLIKGAKSRSVKFGHEFDLTIEWARQRWTGKCELTGIEFVISSGCIGFLSPSLDKIEPAKGYTQANCRFILACLNSFKGAATDADMMLVARALVAKE